MNQKNLDILWQEQINMPHYEGKVCGLFGKMETYEPFSACGGCNPKQEAVNKLPFGIDVDMCVCEGNCGGSYYILNVGVVVGIIVFLILLFYVLKFIFRFPKSKK